MENIIKQCDCETIAEIFQCTVLCKEVNPSVWLKLIFKYGKRSEMLEYFKNIKFWIGSPYSHHKFVYLFIRIDVVNLPRRKKYANRQKRT